MANTDKLHSLIEDWDRYQQISDPKWRAEMQRAVVIEMEVEVGQLKAAGPPSCQSRTPIKRPTILRWRDAHSHHSR